MNALHEAAARTIALAYGDEREPLEQDEHAAAAAIGVVLAEAQRAIETSKPAVSAALREHNWTGLDVPADECDCCAREALGVVLAVLAGLAEDTP